MSKAVWAQTGWHDHGSRINNLRHTATTRTIFKSDHALARAAGDHSAEPSAATEYRGRPHSTHQSGSLGTCVPVRLEVSSGCRRRYVALARLTVRVRVRIRKKRKNLCDIRLAPVRYAGRNSLEDAPCSLRDGYEIKGNEEITAVEQSRLRDGCASRVRPALKIPRQSICRIMFHGGYGAFRMDGVGRVA